MFESTLGFLAKVGEVLKTLAELGADLWTVGLDILDTATKIAIVAGFIAMVLFARKTLKKTKTKK